MLTMNFELGGLKTIVPTYKIYNRRREQSHGDSHKKFAPFVDGQLNWFLE